MRWLKRDMWKAGLAIAGMLLLLVLTVWVPVSAAGAYEGAWGLAGPGTATVQATPTEDATMTALNKEQLTQQVAGQQHTWGNWLWSNAATIVSSFLSTLVLVIGALIGFWQWRVNRKDTKSTESEDRRVAQDKELKDRQDEREKRAEERFQAAVTGLGNDKEGPRVGAAILLRTFLRPGYEQFYTQVFDLAVANLRLPRTSQAATDPDDALPLTTLSQSLIIVFKEAFPLVRSQNKGTPQAVDATGIQLDHAYLREADLEQVWMPQVFLRAADLGGAKLCGANLEKAKLCGANLEKAKLCKAKLLAIDLRKTNLNFVDLSEALLTWADLSEANIDSAKLSETDFSWCNLWKARLGRARLERAKLREADLREVYLGEADLTEADLTKANLSKADLTKANLSKATLSEAKLIGAYLWEAKLGFAHLSSADLSEARLNHADLTGANFWEASLNKANLIGADLSGANLSGADLSGADLGGADLGGANFWEADLTGAYLIWADLTRADLAVALSLKDTNLNGAEGLTKERVEVYKARGAIIGDANSHFEVQGPHGEIMSGRNTNWYEDSTTSSSQFTVTPPPPSQSNDAQAPSVPPAQVNAPTPGTDGSSTTSSKPSNNAQEQSAPSSQESAPTSGADDDSTTSSQPRAES